MTALDIQFGVKTETNYGEPVVVDRFYETDGQPRIIGKFGRVRSNALRSGQRALRSDRQTPYKLGAEGDVTMPVLSKGFGWWLPFLLGTLATTGPTDSVYTHTGTVGPMIGDSFTAQVGRPLNPSGTVQPFTYHGCKVPTWSLNNSVEGALMLTPSLDAEDEDTTTALAVPSYPTGAEPLTWVGGVITLGGTQVDVSEIGIECDNHLKTDRRYIRGNPLKKEPVEAALRELTASLQMDFESLAQRVYVASQTAAGNLATLVCTWTAPTLAGAATYPHLKATIPLSLEEFDVEGGPEPLTQSLSGIGVDALCTLEYRSTDATA